MLRLEALLAQARRQLEDVRDALAAVSAHSAVGEGALLLQATSRLEEAVQEANRDCQRVRRLLQHLGAAAMPEAAEKLCVGGRPLAARSMMTLHELIAGLASAQADIGAFLEECLGSLEMTRQTTGRQTRGGRLLGSA